MRIVKQQTCSNKQIEKSAKTLAEEVQRNIKNNIGDTIKKQFYSYWSESEKKLPLNFSKF